jgi:hypothetical protein
MWRPSDHTWLCEGFVSNYTVWIHHGETVVDQVAPEEDDAELISYPVLCIVESLVAQEGA